MSYILNSQLSERVLSYVGVDFDQRDKTSSLGTVIGEKDVRMEQVRGELTEGFEIFQRMALTLEKENTNKWGIHNGAMNA